MQVSVRKLLKRQLERVFGSSIGFAITDKLLNPQVRPYIRAVTYHDTPVRHRGAFMRQLRWLQGNFANCGRKELREFLGSGRWLHEKPGIILTFDDGLRSNYEIAAPLLEECGFSGWFMVPADAPSLTVAQQRAFASRALIIGAGDDADGAMFMNWSELRELRERGHEVCCHSRTHRRLAATLDAAALAAETVTAKGIMEAELGSEIASFAWVGGEEWAYSAEAFSQMRAAGFREVFCTNCKPILSDEDALWLERSHLDATYTLEQMRFVLGGIYDRLYLAKRRRIRRKLTTLA